MILQQVNDVHSRQRDLCKRDKAQVAVLSLREKEWIDTQAVGTAE